MRLSDRDALRDWEAFKINIRRSTPVDLNESADAQEKRKALLLMDEISFAKYYFPHYCQSDFADFHKRFFKSIIKHKRRIVTRKWARAHAKSVVGGVLAPIFLLCKGELKNMILASRTYDNAVELLHALIAELEANQRLLHDFGPFMSLDQWESGKWVTCTGVSFRAIGAGQSPRGARNEEVRPDYIFCDDLDDEAVSRNPKRLDELYDWVTGALFGCFDIIGTARFVIVNNVIAKDCVILRATKISDDDEQINILEKHEVDPKLIRDLNSKLRDVKEEAERTVIEKALTYAKEGYRPSWRQRFSLLDVCYMIVKMGSRISQREYFNNPQSDGKVFKKKWMQFKKLPPMNKYVYPLIAYLDPGFSKSSKADTKALILVGIWQSEYHIRKVFCDHGSVEDMIGWCYAMDSFVKENNGAYKLRMEEVFLQKLLYTNFSEAARKRKYPVPVSGDTRAKPDKDARIESTAGYFERGDVFFDERLKDEHHTQNLLEQYFAFEPGVKSLKDGPDAVEGAFFELQQSVQLNGDVHVGKRNENKHRI